MPQNELIAKIHELRELQTLIEEAAAEAETIKDSIKSIMGGQEELRVGEYKVTWKSVTSQKLDSAAFKKAMPDTYSAFTREATSRRFCVA